FSFFSLFFFFQAEDGIRDRNVTGVQTCALPISFFIFVLTNAEPFPGFTCWNSTTLNTFPSISNVVPFLKSPAIYTSAIIFSPFRSEERRVGKECRSVICSLRLYRKV